MTLDSITILSSPNQKIVVDMAALASSLNVSSERLVIAILYLVPVVHESAETAVEAYLLGKKQA